MRRDYTQRFDREQFEREVQAEQEKQERAWAAELATKERQRAEVSCHAALRCMLKGQHIASRS
jgi:hypothetical protein